MDSVEERTDSGSAQPVDKNVQNVTSCLTLLEYAEVGETLQIAHSWGTIPGDALLHTRGLRATPIRQ